MSPRLVDVLDREALDVALREGFVVRREHRFAPLAILNYTERCQYEQGAWNATTMACRGIIYDTRDETVVARPFPKFFNHGQREAPPLDLASPAVVTDKLDGSLGILYPDLGAGGFAVATRGAFESEQAQHATAVWEKRYSGYEPPEGYTLLFEILFPDNRIVVDYGDVDDLFLLGAVNVRTGKSLSPTHPLLDGWCGPRALVMECDSLGDALSLTPRPNCEGVVVHVLDSDHRVKIKQEDYVALHRIVTGLNERTVWEHCAAGKPLADLLNPIPDELHEWVRDVAARLTATVEGQAAEIERAYAEIIATLPPGYSRKDFAMLAVKHDLKWALFSRLDGKPYVPDLWKHARPEAHWPRGVAHSEDTA